jgi:hypothetical protein
MTGEVSKTSNQLEVIKEDTKLVEFLETNLSENDISDDQSSSSSSN